MTTNNHGDLVLIPAKIKPPKTAKSAKIHILQASDTTGNRHEVVGENILYWKRGDREFIHCDNDYKIRHCDTDFLENYEEGEDISVEDYENLEQCGRCTSCIEEYGTDGYPDR